MTDKQGSEVSLDRVKAVRGGHRATATKYVKEMEQLINTERTESDKNRLEVLEKMLEKKLHILEDLNGQILDTCDADIIQDEIDLADEVSTRIWCVLNMAKKVCGSGSDNGSVKQTKTTEARIVDSASDLNQGNEASKNGDASDGTIDSQQGGNDIIHTFSRDPQVKPKLPKLTIAKFSGDVTKFQTFWDIFQNSVHNNPHMSDIDKFNYLQGLLEGSAYRAIQGLSMTQANYKAALEILQERFGNTQMIISAHMDELLKLPTCDSDSKLRLAFDKVSVNIRGLESLGVTSEQYGSFLIPAIMSKLPHDICIQIARVTKAKMWNFQEILEILGGEIQAREMSSFIKAKERKPVESFKLPSAVNMEKRHHPTASTFAVEANSRNKQWIPNCAFCNEEHFSSSCNTVTNIPKRKEILRDTHKCFICFKTGHTAFKCSSGKRCEHCTKRHHHSICDQGNSQTHQNKSINSTQGDPTTVTNTATVTKAAKVLLQTATAYVSSCNMDQPVKARILLDGGSQRSYITHALADKLRLKKQRSENLNLNTFGNDRFTRKRCDVVTFDICSGVERYPHLDGLDLADGNDRDSIDILIGSDFYWDIVTGEIIKGDTGPVALDSKLGWILSGRAGESSQQSCVTNLLIEEPVINNNQNGGGEVSDSRENDELVQQLKRFWEVEFFGIDNGTDTEGRTFLPEICFDTHIQRYEVKLPWNNSNEASSSLYDTCHARLFQLRSRLQKDPKLFEEYDKIIHQQKEQGIIEEVSDMKCEEANFLPHHGVVRSDKETTKLRIVYDGSAKDRNSASLNDMLETGPNLTPPIFDILIKFRTYQIGLTADIEKAFHQISIHPDDRRKLRFLWFDNFKDTKDPKVKQYQFCRLVFGLTSSPAILNSTIRFHLNHYISQSEELVKLLKQSVYVDDLVSGARTATEAVHIYKETDTIMKEGGFHFRKWKSNDMMVKQSFQPAESIDDKSEVRVLGTVWNSNRDALMVDLQDVIEYGLQLPLTKRSILKLSAKVFDPLGLLTPFTVHFKIVFQQLCHEGVEWDEPLDGKLKRWWSSLFDDLHCLTSVHIPRCYFDKEKPVLCHQLHGFCDASQDAFAAVVYLRTECDSGEVDVQITASKTRVSPMKKQTIPRLELLGATLLARLMKTISTAFQSVGFFVKERWYWTDSFTALCWIKNSRQWKQYVQHRVDEIRETSAVDGWRFCPEL